jgi:hypothetical protein
MLSKDQQVPIEITPGAEMQYDKKMDLIKNWQDCSSLLIEIKRTLTKSTACLPAEQRRTTKTWSCRTSVRSRRRCILFLALFLPFVDSQGKDTHGLLA